MHEIAVYILENWVVWLFTGLFAFVGWTYRRLMKLYKTNETKSHAQSMGLQALLRDSIIKTYNKSLERGFCPIYQKQSLERIYSAYHNLGGNDVATEIYEETMKMKTEGDDL